jgi:predicted branched-subunit amino acid permease
MMSASLSQRLKAIKKHWIIFIAFGVTDETFSVSSLSSRKLDVPFLLALHTVAYCSWIAGTIVGYLVGAILPIAVQSSLGIGLYAMFMALLIPEVKKSTSVLLLAIFSGIVYATIYYLKLLPSSWNLIATIIIASSVGVLFLKDDTAEDITL